MRKFIIESERGGQWFVCEGTHLDYKILKICYSKDEAIRKKNGMSFYKEDDE